MAPPNSLRSCWWYCAPCCASAAEIGAPADWAEAVSPTVAQLASAHAAIALSVARLTRAVGVTGIRLAPSTPVMAATAFAGRSRHHAVKTRALKSRSRSALADGGRRGAADGEKAFFALPAKLLSGLSHQRVQLFPDRRAESFGRRLGIAMRAADRLRHDSVDNAQLGQILRGHLHCLGRQRRPFRGAPPDRSATFGRDDRIDRVLKHQHPFGT